MVLVVTRFVNYARGCCFLIPGRTWVEGDVRLWFIKFIRWMHCVHGFWERCMSYWLFAALLVDLAAIFRVFYSV